MMRFLCTCITHTFVSPIETITSPHTSVVLGNDRVKGQAVTFYIEGKPGVRNAITPFLKMNCKVLLAYRFKIQAKQALCLQLLQVKHRYLPLSSINLYNCCRKFSLSSGKGSISSCLEKGT